MTWGSITLQHAHGAGSEINGEFRIAAAVARQRSLLQWSALDLDCGGLKTNEECIEVIRVTSHATQRRPRQAQRRSCGHTRLVPSPAKGVERRMLFRMGDEKARATSIVRYAPNSHFPRHAHPGGEEFLVLEGVFQDETGDFPVDTYVRNPPTSAHAPGTDSGCTIFVKLWQFKESDRERIVSLPGDGGVGDPRPGVSSSRVLFDGADERVLLEEWEPGAQIELRNTQGLELLVLAGEFAQDADTLDPWTWLRLPAGQALHARVGSHGARVWYKLAPLLHEDVCAFDNGNLTA